MLKNRHISNGVACISNERCVGGGGVGGVYNYNSLTVEYFKTIAPKL